MNLKTTALLIGLLCVCVRVHGEQPRLRVYLPRTLQVDTDALDLGTVALLRCRESHLLRTASAIAMETVSSALPSSVIKEQLVITRRTILARLAGSGIPKSDVSLTGAEQVTIRRNEVVITGEDLLKAAEGVLRTHQGGADAGNWRVVGDTEELVLPVGEGKSELRPHLLENCPVNRPKIRVAVIRDTKQIGARDVTFTRVYPHRQAVALRDIRPGEKITPKNAEIRTTDAGAPGPKEFVSPFGEVARIAMKAGKVILPGAMRTNKRDITIRRDQIVVMRISGAGFTISGLGKSLQDASVGDIIKVRNVDTNRIVVGRVGLDGTVTPIPQEVSK